MPTTATFAEDRIRNATLLDFAELGRLLSAAAHKVADYFARGHLLVFERRDGSLQAACHVDMQPGRSTIDLLVVDPLTRDASVRLRMLGVASALCEAHGCPEPNRA